MNEYDRDVLYLKCTIDYPDTEAISINHSRHNAKEFYPKYDTNDNLRQIDFIPRTSKWVDVVNFNAKYEYKEDTNEPILILSASFKRDNRTELVIAEWIKFAERAIGRMTTDNHPVEVIYMGLMNETHTVEKPKPNPKRKK